MTGREGSFHGLRNREYGTDLVAGVTPGKGGQDVEGVPVFDTVHAAVEETDANTAMVFVPPPFAADAIYEAADAGIATIICITEGIPAHDMLRVYNHLQGTDSRLIGPNCPGVLSPGKANVGIIPPHFFSEGSVGLLSRSGTLTYQIGNELAQLGVGNSTIVGIGGDPIIGSSFIDVIAQFEQDDQTELIVMVGEIGGDEEERTAEYIEEQRDQAGGRLHRRLHRTARQAHGPRGRDHLRLIGHRPGEGGGAGVERGAGGTNPTEVAKIAAERVKGLGRSPQRSSQASTRAAPATVTAFILDACPPDLISFARGAPSLDIIPVEQCVACAERVLARDPAGALSYGGGVGLWAAAGVDRGAPRRRMPSQVMVTNGSLEGGIMLFRHVVAPGERAMVEAPTYDRTLLALREGGADVKPIPLEDDGIDVEALEEGWPRAGFPSCCTRSPTSTTRPAARWRAGSASGCCSWRPSTASSIFEDDPYGELRFEGEDLPSMLSQDEAGSVVYACSFSKTIAPGVRVGYLIGPHDTHRGTHPRGRRTPTSPPTCWPRPSCPSSATPGAIEQSIADVKQALRERRDALAVGLRAAHRRRGSVRAARGRLLPVGGAAPGRGHQGDAGGRGPAGRDLRGRQRLHARGRHPRPAARLLGGHAGAGEAKARASWARPSPRYAPAQRPRRAALK